jgi:hypothetical protein
MKCGPLSAVLATLAALPLAGADPLVVACSPDKPSVSRDESVTLRAFFNSPAARANWTVTQGVIDSAAAEAVWKFSGTPAGIYRASVQVDGPEGSGTCTLRVVVTEKVRGTFPGSGNLKKPKPPQRETGRGFLTPNQKEPAGYALYSYLLLGAAPVESTRERYLVVLDAWLRLAPALDNLMQSIRPAEINATFLLVDGVPPADVSATWILQHYDYARARSILRLGPAGLRDGPYFISSTTPLLGATSIQGQWLLQNLSAVPTSPKELPFWWVREFLNQAAQQRFWDTKNADEFALRLRTSLGVLALALPEVQTNLKYWVSWIH